MTTVNHGKNGLIAEYSAEIAEITASAASEAVQIFDADPKSRLYSDRAKLHKVAELAANLCFGIRPITEEGEQ